MPSEFDASPGKAISLEVLIALNQEITSLSRAGIPLAQGLREIAIDQPGRLGELSNVLAQRMSRGESLSEALSEEGDRIPRVYRAVVEAGLRAGRLPVALEALTNFALEMLELRRRIGFALLYPTIVVSLAYGLFLLLILEVTARIRETYDMIGLPVPLPLSVLGRIGETAVYWSWLPPVLLFTTIFLWSRSSTANRFNPTTLTFPLAWIPGFKRIAANHQAANFSQLLAMMIEHEIPLQEGIVLSADATTSSSFAASARAVADALSRGESLEKIMLGRSDIPPFLRWLMAGRGREGSLLEGLRLATEMYRRRANDQAAWLRLAFPLATAVVIGGGATLLYALALFLPMAGLLRDMALETSPY